MILAATVGLAAASPAEAAPSEGASVFWTWMEKGGDIMWILLALSVLGVAVTLERLFKLRRASIAPVGLAREAPALWAAGKADELRGLCLRRESALGRVLLLALEHRQAEPAQVSALAGDAASREVRAQIQKAFPLVIVATLAPLLGLLGTVLGMIQSFDMVALAPGAWATPRPWPGAFRWR